MADRRQAKARRVEKHPSRSKQLLTRRSLVVLLVTGCFIGGSVATVAAMSSSGKAALASSHASGATRLTQLNPADISSTTVPVTTTTTTIGNGSAGTFVSISCPTSSVCVAVGDDGQGGALIESSSDGGSSFTPQSAPSGTGPLTAVDCPDATNCVAVGDSTLLSSSDGGSTWSSATSPTTGADLLAVTCATSSECIAVGMLPRVTQADAASVLYSDDGGNTWAAAQVPSWVSGMGAVTCTSATSCIAVGGSVLVSSDGGQSWSNETVAGGLQYLSALACSATPAASELVRMLLVFPTRASPGLELPVPTVAIAGRRQPWPPVWRRLGRSHARGIIAWWSGPPTNVAIAHLQKPRTTLDRHGNQPHQ